MQWNVENRNTKYVVDHNLPLHGCKYVKAKDFIRFNDIGYFWWIRNHWRNRLEDVFLKKHTINTNAFSRHKKTYFTQKKLCRVEKSKISLSRKKSVQWIQITVFLRYLINGWMIEKVWTLWRNCIDFTLIWNCKNRMYL